MPYINVGVIIYSSFPILAFHLMKPHPVQEMLNNEHIVVIIFLITYYMVSKQLTQIL